jgi:acetylglutamate kinase
MSGRDGAILTARYLGKRGAVTLPDNYDHGGALVEVSKALADTIVLSGNVEVIGDLGPYDSKPQFFEIARYFVAKVDEVIDG